jgi:hypothetical protein
MRAGAAVELLAVALLGRAGAAVPPLPAPALLTGAGGVYLEPVPDLDVGHRHYTAPPDGPPPPGDVFAPPCSNVEVAAEAPAIAEFTRQAGPDRSVALLGRDFTLRSGAASGSDTRVWAYTQTTAEDGVLYEPALLRLAADSLAIATTSGPAYGLVLLWVENGRGVSHPVRVNATEPWWLGPTHARTGACVSVYGQNLSHDQGTNSSVVRVRPWGADSNTPSVACALTDVNPYRLTFRVPEAAAGGADYEVWVHNGHGGRYGWGGPLRLRVDSADPFQWTGAVRTATDYGAVPDDGLDDTAAIQAALGAAADGDVVRLPAGTFQITNRLTCNRAIAFEGAGTNLTTLRIADVAYAAAATLRLQGAPVRVRDLTFSSAATGRMANAMVMVDWREKEPVPAGALIERCRFEAPTDASCIGIEAGWGNEITVRDCVFTQSRGVWLYKGRQFRVLNNAFYGNGRVYGANAFSTWAARELDVSGNRGSSLNRTNQQALKRLYVGACNWGVTRDGYVADNASAECGPLPTDADQNGGENLLLEPGGHHFSGRPTEVTETALRFAGATWKSNAFVTDDRPGWDPQYDASLAFVRSGRGMGQWRSILSNSVDTLVVDRPWDVLPDTNSVIGVGECAARFAVVCNRLDGLPDDDGDGTPDYLTRVCAVTGVMLYGACVDTVIAENTIQRMRYGIFCGGLGVLGTTTSVLERLSNLRVADNVITGCYVGIRLCNYALPSPGAGDAGVGPLLLNAIVRDNRLQDIADYALAADRMHVWYHWDWPWIEGSVFEANRVTQARTGAVLGKQQGSTVLRKNAFDRNTWLAGSVGVSFDPYSETPRLYGNTYTAIASNYAGTLPGSGLQPERRRLEFAGSARLGPAQADAVALRNVGTTALVAQTAADAPWLSAEVRPAIVTDECARAEVVVRVDPALASAGTHTGTVTLTGGDLYCPQTLGVRLDARPGIPPRGTLFDLW